MTTIGQKFVILIYTMTFYKFSFESFTFHADHKHDAANDHDGLL